MAVFWAELASDFRSEATPRMCGDPNMKYTDQWQRQRGLAVDMGIVDAEDVGCWGLSKVAAALPYVSMNNLHLIPFAHAGLYGVVKDFYRYLLGTKKTAAHPGTAGIISNAAKKVMSNRAAHIVQTMDFDRPYRDIIHQRGEWTMEDWLHWTETWSVFVLGPYKNRSNRIVQVRL